jgi:hypothetical protein
LGYEPKERAEHPFATSCLVAGVTTPNVENRTHRPVAQTYRRWKSNRNRNPSFAKAFPKTMALGEKKEHILTGVGGSTTQHSVAIEKLRFTLAGKTTLLSPATVLLQKTMDPSEWAAGNLGYDLIRQAAPFTIDFRLMRLSAR